MNFFKEISAHKVSSLNYPLQMQLDPRLRKQRKQVKKDVETDFENSNEIELIRPYKYENAFNISAGRS